MRPIIYTVVTSCLALSSLHAQAPASAPAPASISAFNAPAQGDLKFKDKRLMVLFFDLAGVPVADQRRAQQAALSYINKQLAETDMVAVMSFTGDVTILQDFSNDRGTLARAINNLAIGENGPTNTDRKLTGLQSAVDMLGVLPEKKSLIYFSSVTPVSGTSNQAKMSATVNSALRNNVSFYPVDTRGLPPGGTN